jgi:hypothetical protein
MNTVEGGMNLLSGALPWGSDYKTIFNRYEYDTPAFGDLLELVVPLRAMKSAEPAPAEPSLFGICFVGETPVQTPTGVKRIDELKVGDSVLALDLATNTLKVKSVIRVFHNTDKPVLRIKMIDSAGATEVLGVTSEHPFWIEGQGWVPAEKLKDGDRLRRIDGGGALVLSVSTDADQVDTFNVEVEELHNYFVGQRGVLVHNQSKLKGGESPAAQRGREAHKNYENALGKDSYEFNKALPSGRRPDAVDYTTNTVRELKPDNPNAMRRGMRQLERYVKELEDLTGRVWKGILDTYRR